MTPQEASLSSLILRWAKDPELFVHEALKIKTISTQQKQALEELRKLVWAKINTHPSSGKKRHTAEEKAYARKTGISIMSGMGTGKDALASWCIIWFLC